MRGFRVGVRRRSPPRGGPTCSRRGRLGSRGRLRIRMAVHTGTAFPTDGDYLGPPLNRCARLLDAGHGGQILLSSTSAGLARAEPLEGAELVNMGRFHLPGLSNPEEIHQLVSERLPGKFPALRVPPVSRSNLPARNFEVHRPNRSPCASRIDSRRNPTPDTRRRRWGRQDPPRPRIGNPGSRALPRWRLVGRACPDRRLRIDHRRDRGEPRGRPAPNRNPDRVGDGTLADPPNPGDSRQLRACRRRHRRVGRCCSPVGSQPHPARHQQDRTRSGW